MKQEYVNPFLAPAALVWQKEVGHTLQFESAEAVSHKYTSEDITAAVGVSGQLRGNVLYGFPLDTARALIDVMVSSDTDLNSELALSALGELANMITGNAATELSKAGFSCDISPPIMIESVGTVISSLGRPQILVSFKSAVGAFNIRVELSESNL